MLRLEAVLMSRNIEHIVDQERMFTPEQSVSRFVKTE